jgi:hypothetical protein
MSNRRGRPANKNKEVQEEIPSEVLEGFNSGNEEVNIGTVEVEGDIPTIEEEMEKALKAVEEEEKLYENKPVIKEEVEVFTIEIAPTRSDDEKEQFAFANGLRLKFRQPYKVNKETLAALENQKEIMPEGEDISLHGGKGIDARWYPRYHIKHI